MENNKKDYEGCIEVDGIKYKLVLTKDGKPNILRNEEIWILNTTYEFAQFMFSLMKDYEKLEVSNVEKDAEIAKLKFALEYYANDENYDSWFDDGSSMCNISEEGGVIAKEALGYYVK